MKKVYYQPKKQDPRKILSVLNVNICLREKFGLDNTQTLVLDALRQLQGISFSNQKLSEVVGKTRHWVEATYKELQAKNLIDANLNLTEYFFEEAQELLDNPRPFLKEDSKEAPETLEMPFKDLIKKTSAILEGI
jgi:DNA-binding MarR family transcriptional regulator